MLYRIALVKKIENKTTYLAQCPRARRCCCCCCSRGCCHATPPLPTLVLALVGGRRQGTGDGDVKDKQVSTRSEVPRAAVHVTLFGRGTGGELGQSSCEDVEVLGDLLRALLVLVP